VAYEQELCYTNQKNKKKKGSKRKSLKLENILIIFYRLCFVYERRFISFHWDKWCEGYGTSCFVGQS